MITLSKEKEAQLKAEYHARKAKIDAENLQAQVEREKVRSQWILKRQKLPRKKVSVDTVCDGCGVVVPSGSEVAVAKHLDGHRGDWVMGKRVYCENCVKPKEGKQ